jgi:extracellular elastinolytic metalloproteinase
MSHPPAERCRRSHRALRAPGLLALATATLLTAMLSAGTASAIDQQAQQGHDQRNFDARAPQKALTVAPQDLAQQNAVAAMRAQMPELMVTFDASTGVTRSLYHRTDYLTAPAAGDPLDIALDWVKKNARALGLSPSDVQHYEITDNVYSAVTGASHIYLRQTHRNIPLYNGQLHINVNRDGQIISVNNAFLANFAQAVNPDQPALSAAQAVERAAQHLGLDVPTPAVLSPGQGPRQTTQLDPTDLSLEPIEASLMWMPIQRGEARLVWNFQIATTDAAHWYDFTVDGQDGTVWTRFDWTAGGTYRVYKEPDESPLHGTTGRQLVANPEDGTASPNGWFTGGTMSGNNVTACPDTSPANNACDSNPQCSGTTCDFAINLTQAPSQYVPAATANLFYWNNLIHDVQYQYGFDEVGGNFQENNFGKGGAGSDSVNADAQDGSGNCNANFSTPTDGGNPRMQMYTCNMASPSRDGDLDNGVIVHEYGHGISIRQVGGPGNSSCLNNTQQPGEGWSDWFGLVYTAENGDAGTDSRGIGTYLFGQAPNGPGIRDLPYSTNPSVNNWTYESISGAGIPHGVGSRWAQAIWEVYWALVAKHGFAAGDQLLDPVGGGWTGSHRALLYVNEGLKNTACSPTFLDTRDGVIQAATDNFGGEDVCDIWQAFAAYGLGTDAATGGSGSTSATNGFSVPAECLCSPNPVANAGPDQNICLGDSTSVGTPANPSTTYSWAPGGQTTAQITVSPTTTTTYTVTATTSCGSANDSATVFVDDGSTPAGLNDDFEGDNSDWATTGLWHAVTNSTCASPGYSSPLNAFYYGQDGACTYDTGGTTSGTLTSPSISGITATSTLTFDYYRVVESFSGDYDRTQVNILAGGNSTTVFSLNSSNASTAAWVSSGVISLSAFAGQTIQVQFVFNSVDGVSNAFTGWLIDDVVVTGDSSCTPTGNTAPTVTITAPADGSSFQEGTSVGFSGTATDAEDGTLTGSLSWTSNLDGSIGSGGSFSTATLSVGTHSITASVTDSGGLPGSDAITVTITAAPVNTPPTVTITAPADGSSFVEGTSVGFSGTATDAEDGTLTGSLSWTSSLDGSIGSGGSFSTATLSVGTHSITASVTDSGGLPGSDNITVTITADPGGGCTDCIDWSTTATVSYADQDVSGSVTVEDGGDTLFLQANTWRRTTQTFTVGPNTVLEFEYSSTDEGEINGIGFDENDTLNDAPRHYQFWGTQNWTGTGKIRETAQQYSGSGAFETFTIPVGQDLSGTFFLVLINDNDAGTGNGRFRNVRVYEDTPPPGSCAADVDFENGTTNGWINSGSCTTGAFVVGTPTQVIDSGVTTQVGGDHTTGSGNALFTAPNTSAGVNDVDGGECITTSPTYAVSEASDVSVWFFHGQRDAGDDPGGDFFFVEISRNGGSTWSTLASFGDVTVNAAWTQVTTTAAAGENVRFRVRASDGAGPGDLVEAGIDDVTVCPTP